ncbi:ABC transporter, ATP-binding/permease protein [Lentisphaera araneosa HTCC2155]|uniref:ABC transporter, ATP-binding/permease protein n=1 Tax=Lentisphaera araneosa HTCC2155 TaxID=313628 RepID=A6DRP5_9BACT|nr:ABC transporter ATP-binding protein [Lentisphaera araneosa]EDM25714.1 ABC transporter, ATP-binding/permease protein [Lentisphaera araneosa HTCC2155]
MIRKRLEFFFTKDFITQMKVFLKQISHYREIISFSLLLSIIANALGLIPALISGQIVDGYLSGRELANSPQIEKEILLWAGALFLAYVLSEVLNIIQNQVQLRFRTSFNHSLQDKLYKHVLHLPINFFNKTKSGELLSRFTNDINQITGLSNQLILTPINALLRLSVILAYCFYLSPWIALLILLIIGTLTILCMFLTKKTRPLQNEIYDKQAVIHGFLSEVFQGIRTVRSHAKEAEEISQHSQRHLDLNDTRLKSNLQIQGIYTLWSFMQAIAAALMLAGGSIMIIRGHMSLGELVVVQFFTAQLMNPIFNILSSISSTQGGLACLERYHKILSEELDNPPDSNRKKLDKCIEKIKIVNLNFSYLPDKPVLENISFTMQKGKTYALVGTSGSGKSTLADLICGFQKASIGNILINGIELQELNKENYIQHLAIVHQANFVFDGTIRDNILYGNTELTSSDLIELCQKAQLHDFIDSLELGLDSYIGENGIKLSGGQKQRLCLARAFAAKADLIILDEATSHLDSINERLIQKAVFENKNDLITLIIAHNLSTIKDVDQVIVLEKGEIKEIGTHEGLMKLRGLYFNMLKS